MTADILSSPWEFVWKDGSRTLDQPQTLADVKEGAETAHCWSVWLRQEPWSRGTMAKAAPLIIPKPVVHQSVQL